MDAKEEDWGGSGGVSRGYKAMTEGQSMGFRAEESDRKEHNK